MKFDVFWKCMLRQLMLIWCSGNWTRDSVSHFDFIGEFCTLSSNLLMVFIAEFLDFKIKLINLEIDQPIENMSRRLLPYTRAVVLCCWSRFKAKLSEWIVCVCPKERILWTKQKIVQHLFFIFMRKFHETRQSSNHGSRCFALWCAHWHD